MLFVGRYTSANLSLTTPPDFCCNCGEHGVLEYVETPMKKVRFFLMFGTELTLTEHFPYCAGCKRSAKRVRQGWLAKFLVMCVAAVCLFMGLIAVADALPRLMNQNLFTSAVILSTLLTLAWYHFQEWGRQGASFYQPVSLANAYVDGDRIAGIELKFHNPQYGEVIQRANAELIQVGLFKVL